MALFLTVEDPEGTAPVLAYCVLAEMHFNYESKAAIGILKCWRSQEAFAAKRKAFNSVQLVLAPNDGGPQFFERPDAAVSQVELGKSFLAFCVETGKLLPLNPDLKPDNG